MDSFEDEYYRNDSVLYKIIRYLYNREFALITSKVSENEIKNHIAERNLRCHNVQGLNYLIRWYDVISNKINLYYSLAEYKHGLPLRFLGDKERDFEVTSDWNKNHWKEMIHYDFLIDIDAKNQQQMKGALYTAMKLRDMLIKNRGRFEVRFSGRGFHFIILNDFYKDLKDPFKPNTDINIFTKYRKLADKFNQISEQIDVNIYDSRRLVKVPYSLAFYDDGAFVCCPVTTLENFDRNYYKLENFILK